MPDARSLIVVAFRDSLVRFSFAGQGEVTKLAVPPTYLHWQEKDKKVEDVLNGILGLEGYRATPAAVPKKLLAVRGGLAVYRKNNITYIDGMGSFHRLTAFYSDLPCKKDGWREPVMMALCERCLSCVRHSPTGAIDPDRFLLRAEKCLVFLNEKPGRVAFPDWVEGSWHNCLVGCMKCQSVCPANREALDWREDGGEFSEEETALLLEGAPLAELPTSLVEKLRRWDLLQLQDVLPRNLGVRLCERVSGRDGP